MEQKDNKKSLKERLQNSKTAERIFDISITVACITIMLVFVGVASSPFAILGVALFNLSNKLFFIIYVLFIIGIITAWIVYNVTPVKSKIHIFLNRISKALTYVLCALVILYSIVIIMAVGYALWKFNWLCLLLYVPVVLSFYFVAFSDVFDIW